MNWQLALIAAAVLPCSGCAASRSANASAKSRRNSGGWKARSAAQFTESIRRHRTVQALSLEEQFSAPSPRSAKKNLKQDVKANASPRARRSLDVLIASRRARALGRHPAVIEGEISPGISTFHRVSSPPTARAGLRKIRGRLGKASAAGERVMICSNACPTCATCPAPSRAAFAAR